MYDLYVFTTGNSWKTTIMAEELGEPYTCHAVNIGKGEGQKPEYKKISPTGKVPAIFDHDTGGSVYGSPAILVYLADKYGKFLPKSGKPRGETLDWTMFALTDLGVAFNTWNKFANRLPTKDQFAIDESWSEVARFLKTADERLATTEYLAGKDYSIADMSVIPFVGGSRRKPEVIAAHKNLARWLDTVEARPAVKRGLALPKVS